MMKRIINSLMRIRTRFYVAAFIILASVAVTPWAVENAYIDRGYRAVGGEVLIIPMGIILAWLILDILSELDLFAERRRNVESNNE